MTLVDTSVWVDHFRFGNKQLTKLIEGADVLTHPLVIGELACGNFKNRKVIFELLLQLPFAKTISFEELLPFIELHKFYGKGVGIVDVQIMAACLLTNADLFTLDKKLDKVFRDLN